MSSSLGVHAEALDQQAAADGDGYAVAILDHTIGARGVIGMAADMHLHTRQIGERAMLAEAVDEIPVVIQCNRTSTLTPGTLLDFTMENQSAVMDFRR